MINEHKLSQILCTTKKINENNKTFFGSPLKKFINNFYTKFEIPKESFIISLYYIYKFYNINKHDEKLMNTFFNEINIYMCSSIIIALKQIYDEPINVKNICDILYINYEKLKSIELILLEGINWDIFYDNEPYNDFIKHIENYKLK